MDSAMQRRIAAVVVIVFIGVAVAGLLYAGSLLRGISGITALAGSDDRIVLALAGEFYVLDGDGHTRAEIDTRANGFVEPLSALAFLPGGDLLVAGDTGASLQRCAFPELHCTGWQPASGKAPVAPLSLLVEPDRLWISETDRHRVHAFAGDGTRLDTPLDDADDQRTMTFLADRASRPDPDAIPAIDGVVYPHGLLRLDDTLLLANTGRQEILRVSLDDGTVGKPERFTGDFGSHNAAGFRYPLQLAADGAGGLFVTVGDLRSTRSSLLQLDGRGDVVREVVLRDAVNPRDLLATSRGVLVADREVPRVWQVDAQGLATEFGDDALRAKLASLRATQRQAELATTLCQVLLALLVLAAIGIAVLDRRANAPAGTPAPAVNGASEPARRWGAVLGAALVFGLFSYPVALGFSLRTAVLFFAGGVLAVALWAFGRRQREVAARVVPAPAAPTVGVSSAPALPLVVRRDLRRTLGLLAVGGMWLVIMAAQFVLATRLGKPMPAHLLLPMLIPVALVVPLAWLSGRRFSCPHCAQDLNDYVMAARRSRTPFGHCPACGGTVTPPAPGGIGK